MAAGWEKEIEALYRLDPEEFVAARNELAKQVRNDDRKAATEIRNLAKPTIAAWAVNQVALSRPKLVSAVVTATDELQAAQNDALGGNRATLKAATEKRRKAVGAVVDAAVSALDAVGRNGEPHRDTLRNTVEAASLDGAAAALLQAGRLEREFDPPAVFGGFATADVAPQPRRERRERRSPQAAPEEDTEELEREARRARAEAEDLAELAATARERAQDAAQECREAREALTAAERQLTDAKRTLDRAMDNAKTTSMRAAEVERKADEARSLADDLEASLKR